MIPALTALLAIWTDKPLHATQIIWDVLIGRPHVTSAGQPLPESTVFLLGVFDAGFVPTAANRAEWAQRWHTASLARWDRSTRYYSGEVNFTTNTAPFTAGTQAWVWGVSGSEWILLRRPTWNWPTGSPLGGPPSFWTANSNVTTVAGQVSAPGTTEFFYRTQKVTTELPPALRWNDWLKLHFSAAQLADPAISGPAADPDGDGLPNDAEYAGMTWPAVASSQSALSLETGLVASAAGRHLSLSFFFDPRAVLTLTPETSPDLRIWNAAPGGTVALPATAPGAVSFRTAATVASAPRTFLRLRWAPAR